MTRPTRRTLLLATPALLAAPMLATPASATQDDPIKLRDLYARDGGLSPLARENLGRRIVVDGFMAPPLRAEADFFVLTKMPMSVCPFCETAAEWPDDILAAYTKRTVRVIPYNRRLVARGVLEHGEYLDPDTSFVSMVRLTDTTYE